MLPEMHLLWGKRRGPPFLVFPNCHIPVPFGPCVCPQQHLPAIDQNMGQNIAFLPTQSCHLRKARQLQDLIEIEPWLVRKFQWSRMRKHCQNGFAKPRTLPVVLPLYYWGPMTTHTLPPAVSTPLASDWQNTLSTSPFVWAPVDKGLPLEGPSLGLELGEKLPCTLPTTRLETIHQCIFCIGFNTVHMQNTFLDRTGCQPHGDQHCKMFHIMASKVFASGKATKCADGYKSK